MTGHSTPYNVASGCFPLCEACWSELSPDERLPYYRQLWQRWLRDGVDKGVEEWRNIEASVMAGR